MLILHHSCHYIAVHISNLLLFKRFLSFFPKCFPSCTVSRTASASSFRKFCFSCPKIRSPGKLTISLWNIGLIVITLILKDIRKHGQHQLLFPIFTELFQRVERLRIEKRKIIIPSPPSNLEISTSFILRESYFEVSMKI